MMCPDDHPLWELAESRDCSEEQFQLEWLRYARVALRGLDATRLLDTMVPVGGEFTVEVYSGASSVHIGCKMQALPALLPWDRELDGRLDVCKHGIILIRLAAFKKIIFACIETPCQSNTLARDPPLRNWRGVYGRNG